MLYKIFTIKNVTGEKENTVKKRWHSVGGSYYFCSMDRVIFEIETGLTAEEHKATFTQWKMKKSMQHLQDALHDLYILMDKFTAYAQEEERKKVNNDDKRIF